MMTQKIINWKYTLLRVLAFCMCCMIVLIVGSSLTKNLPKPWSELLLGIVATVAVFGFTVLFSRWEKIRLDKLGVTPKKGTIRRFIFGFIIGLLLSITHTALVLLFSHAKIVSVSSLSFSAIVFTFLLYFVLALREELAFRGYPLRALYCSIGSWKSQIIIAVIFSLEHIAGGYTITQAFLGAGTGAILFGIAALRSKGIALPVGIHFAWNLGQWCVGFKNEPGIWNTIIEKGYESKHEQITFIMYLIIMGFAILSFYLYRVTDQSKVHNRC
ncbi:MAG TPA: type II CAAX endopeptidase family protein [Flavobacterium sp.]|nr:type II CAAX endopeptidase family protein [Flavobacterium sp.]